MPQGRKKIAGRLWGHQDDRSGIAQMGKGCRARECTTVRQMVVGLV